MLKKFMYSFFFLQLLCLIISVFNYDIKICTWKSQSDIEWSSAYELGCIISFVGNKPSEDTGAGMEIGKTIGRWGRGEAP